MGKKKKGKKTKLVDPNAVTNVDKAFHELLVTDLNTKIERLKNLSEELLISNEEIELQIKVANSEQGDLIASFKRTLYEKSDEVSHYQSLLKESELLRAKEDYDHQAEIIQMFEDYRLAHEQLTSDIKLYSAQLNALEDFRSQRDELFENYYQQQRDMEEREEKHKKNLYEIEKKFIQAKDKLRIDMEARLTQLSTEFQEITAMRIAKTTHRVVRENIAINNELSSMSINNRRLYNENKKLTGNNSGLKVVAKSHNAKKKSILSQCVVQQKVIEGLSKEVAKLKEHMARFDGIQAKVLKLQRSLDAALLQSAKSGHRMRLLEQNLHASRADWTLLKTEFDYCKEDLDRCSSVVYEVLMTIKTALLVDFVPKESSKKLAARRKSIMSNVLAILIDARIVTIKRESLESIVAVKETYDRGDLGFEPKPVLLRSDYPIQRNTDTKMGRSFEDLVAIYVEEQKHMRILEPVAEADDEDLEHERSITMIRSSLKEEGPFKTVFDESSEKSTSSSSEEVTYHVQLPPKKASRASRMEGGGEEEDKYEQEEDEGQEEEEGEEDLIATTEFGIEEISEGLIEEETLSEG